jgi:hypothetical protein
MKTPARSFSLHKMKKSRQIFIICGYFFENQQFWPRGMEKCAGGSFYALAHFSLPGIGAEQWAGMEEKGRRKKDGGKETAEKERRKRDGGKGAMRPGKKRRPSSGASSSVDGACVASRSAARTSR